MLAYRCRQACHFDDGCEPIAFRLTQTCEQMILECVGQALAPCRRITLRPSSMALSMQLRQTGSPGLGQAFFEVEVDDLELCLAGQGLEGKAQV
ncbi:hypothetical protein D3C80_1360770 [compost metagenome]